MKAFPDAQITCFSLVKMAFWMPVEKAPGTRDNQALIDLLRK